MSGLNLSAILYKKGDMRFEIRPTPEPGNGEVLIAVQQVGICASDVKFWKDGSIGSFIVNKPVILGHECSGIVSKIGSGVKHLKIGDRVAIDPHITCRTCEFCKSGRYNMCQATYFLAAPPDDGALARYFVHAADFVFKIPENVSFEEGACIEPLSVGLHACRIIGITIGHRVLITGAGSIGLCSMIIARALGASAVCLTDLDPKRLDFAKTCGATHTVLVEKDDKEEDLALKIADIMGGPPDRIIECSGANFSVNLGIHACKHGGKLVLVGLGKSVISLPVFETIAKEIEIRGSFRYVNTWPTLIEMISSGQINVKPIITHHFMLEDTVKAFEMSKRGEGIKIMIGCAENK